MKHILPQKVSPAWTKLQHKPRTIQKSSQPIRPFPAPQSLPHTRRATATKQITHLATRLRNSLTPAKLSSSRRVIVEDGKIGSGMCVTKGC